MKRKFQVMTAVLCMALFVLMALGSGSSKTDTKEIVTSNNGDASGTKENGDNESPTPDKGNDDSSAVTIGEQVLLDKGGIVITAKEYVSDIIWGDGIKLLVENNTDKAVTVGCNALIVNNCMISDLFVADVAAGKKSNEVMYLSSSELKAAGIDSVGQVEIYFHVYDSDTYEDILDSEHVTIKTSKFDNMDTTPDDSGTELYNKDGIRIVGKTVDENSFWGSAILLYCENKSGKNVGISVEDMSINGFMLSPFFSTTVYDGKMAFDEVTVFSSELEENGIEEINEVELKFRIFDADTYKTIAETDAISFSAK